MAELEEHEARITLGSTWSIAGATSGGIGGNNRQVNVGEFRVHNRERAIGTVTLGIKRTFVSGVGNIGWIHAIITYGVGAANYTVEVDWDNGSSISIPLAETNRVRVDARQFGLIDEGVSLSASFVEAPRAAKHSPTHSTLVLLPPGAAGVPSATDIDVPVRAKSLFVPRAMTGAFGAAPISDLEIRAEQFGPGVLAIWSHQQAADAAIWTTGVLLPPNSQRIRILTLLGTQVQPFPRQAVVFGIDG